MIILAHTARGLRFGCGRQRLEGQRGLPAMLACHCRVAWYPGEGVLGNGGGQSWCASSVEAQQCLLPVA